jgi:hypothetical protein
MDLNANVRGYNMKEYELAKHNSNMPMEVLFVLILCSIFLWVFYFTLPSTAHAQCYRLSDERGTIHFTDTIYRWVSDKGEVYYTNYIVSFCTLLAFFERPSPPFCKPTHLVLALFDPLQTT